MSMASQGIKVFVIGCGIAGPILAIFLKRKGFDPEIFERLDSVTESGLSLMLQPNGCKVLSILDDLHIINELPGKWCERMAHYSQLDGTVLAVNDSPSTLAQFFEYGMIGVRRSDFQQLLVQKAIEQGIIIHWGHQLTSLEQNQESVAVTFKNGISRTASFIVGCDGLHSNTRICLFGQEKPTFTGLVQTGGISPTPDVLKEKATIAEFYGVRAHMITYPISETHSSWAISTAEEEAKESWHSLDSHAKERIKSGPFSEWIFGAGELVKNPQKIIKYGLYDRPELKTWYKDRVVLLGDAAHPTTPHLGQGANQALEDIYHLVRVLCAAIPNRDTGESPTTATLTKLFSEYESIRLPRTATLVRGARTRGERRVTMDEESSRRRDEIIKAEFGGTEFDPKRSASYDFIFGGPFHGKSEI